MAEPAAKDHVTLAVDAGGNFYLGTRGRLDPVPEARLAAALEGAYRGRPGDHVLYLKADREAGYGRVLAALDAARAAGVRTVGAIANRPSSRRDD
jgi:biopolymer transport protein ExbD